MSFNTYVDMPEPFIHKNILNMKLHFSKIKKTSSVFVLLTFYNHFGIAEGPLLTAIRSTLCQSVLQLH